MRHWILYAAVVVMQALDVATTEIGLRTVEGFYEANPIVVAMAGQPPALWKLIALKLIVLAYVGGVVWVSKGGRPIKVVMGLAVSFYVVIIANNIIVIVG